MLQQNLLKSIKMELKFKVITKKQVKFDMSITEIQKYPVHEHYLYEYQEKIFVYDFNPTKKTLNDIENYKMYLCNYLKNLLNAKSVEILGNQ